MSTMPIPEPDDATDDRAFREGVARFLAASGHEDWALNIPGIDADRLIHILSPARI